MSKKHDTAAALAGILKAKRDDNSPAAPETPIAMRVEVEGGALPPPLPCRLPPVPRAHGKRKPLLPKGGVERAATQTTASTPFTFVRPLARR